MLKNFLLTGVLFAISVVLFTTTVGNLDPLGEQKLIALSVFYLSTLCGVTSFFTFLFFFGSELLSGRKLRTQHFLIAVRRGILVGVFVVTLLVLQMFRLLGLFEVTLLAIFLSLLEFIILSSKKGR